MRPPRRSPPSYRPQSTTADAISSGLSGAWAGACTVVAPLPVAPRRTGMRLGSGNQDEPCEGTPQAYPGLRLIRARSATAHGGRGRALARRRRRRRAARGGGHHRADLPAGPDRPGRRPRRRLPRRRAARLLGVGRLAGSGDGAGQRARVQLLPHPADGPLHHLRGRELGRPRRLLHRRARGQHAGRARARTARARPHERRQEADLAAEMARLLLRGASLDEALPAVVAAPRPRARAVVGRDRAARRGRRRAPRRPARWATARWARCSCPPGCATAVLERLRERVVPALDAILGAAIERDALAARGGRDRGAAPLRRAQDRAAARRLARPALAADGDPHRRRRARLDARCRRPSTASWWPTSPARRDAPLAPGRQPARHVAPGGAHRRAARGVVLGRGGARWPPSTTSRCRPGRFALAIDPDLPLIRADAAQLERAFANLLENSARYWGGHPVSVRARAVGSRDPRAHRRPRARRRPPPSSSASSRPFTARRAIPTAIVARGWGWPSCAASSRPTAGACGSSRCPARARPSSSSCRWRRRPRERATAGCSWSTTSARSCAR